MERRKEGEIRIVEGEKGGNQELERGKEGEIRIVEEKERTRVGEREGGRDTYNGRERENKSWREGRRERYV